MASGITLDLLAFDRQQRWRQLAMEDRPARPRDRSLRGKARIKARKAANKAANKSDAV